jgi:hypothetical protein
MLNLMALFFFLLITSCVNEEDKALQQGDCIGVFEEILLIQDLRDQLSSQMQMISSARKQKTIGRTKYIAAFNTWLEKEAELREDVTALYDMAYSKGCFEEGLR